MEKYQFTDEQRTVIEGMQVPFAVYSYVNKRIVTLALSDGFCALFGYDDRASAYYDMDNNMYKDTHPDDVARIADAAFRFAADDGEFDVIYRTKKADGSGYKVVHAVGRHTYTETGARVAHVSYTDEGDYVNDFASETPEFRKSIHSTLSEQSFIIRNQYDYLTGLPNMSYFFELAEAAKDDMLEKGGMPVLLYIDFSGMKFYNSKHGFAQGDQTLKAFAKILADEFSSENCCRIGSDHFAAVTEETGVDERLDRIFKSFAGLKDAQTPPVHVGIYPHHMGDVSASDACDRAKLACGAIHDSYASCFKYFSEEMREEALLRQYIVENIDTAISEKRIQVYYQPIVRAVNEKICNIESLARWIDPVKGMMAPSQFIPALEGSGLIYKLDLHIVECVLEDMKKMKEQGIYVVPHSVNLSRSDFDSCDMVEEIRRRVDDAGISRDRIVVEITESVIGSSYEFMKEQVTRFCDLGFPVWMDDFGSGYSSLELLQNIRFDLLKFDLGFMMKLDEGESGRIILTQLMKMATALGMESICEGVETKDQVRFLQKIGCNKLQGYYYGKPSPFCDAVKWYTSDGEICLENPQESDYYESIGRVNLFDIGVIAKDDQNSFQNAFDTLPVGIIEINGNRTRFVRSNKSYREFIKRYIGVDLSVDGSDFTEFDAPYMYNIVKTCCEKGMRLFYDEKMADGSVVHSFARRIGVNKVNGNVAVAIAVISVIGPDEGTTYADIARALASDYYNIYVVDLDTDRYIEYSSPVGRESLAIERHGENFFESARSDTMTRIYEGDRKLFLSWFSKENIIRELDEQGAINMTYRLVDSGKPMYVTMKITRLAPVGNRIILGISIVDAYMKQKEHYESLQKERDTMVRIMALSDGYMSLYTVDLDTDHYVQYSSSDEFDSLNIEKQGEDFFADSVLNAKEYFHKDDLQNFIEQFTKENVMRKISENGRFIIQYRLMINGEPVPVTLKAGLFKDGEEEKMVVGVRA